MTALINITIVHLAIATFFNRGIGNTRQVVSLCKQELEEYDRFIREHLNDLQEIKNW